MWVCTCVFFYLMKFVWGLAISLGFVIYNFSEVLFWVLIVIEGATALGVVFSMILGCSRLVCKASNAVRASKRGTRYVVCGVVYGIYYLLISIAFFIPNVIVAESFAEKLSGAAVSISMLVFCVFVALIGKTDAIDANS